MRSLATAMRRRRMERPKWQGGFGLRLRSVGEREVSEEENEDDDEEEED